MARSNDIEAAVCLSYTSFAADGNMAQSEVGHRHVMLTYRGLQTSSSA